MDNLDSLIDDLTRLDKEATPAPVEFVEFNRGYGDILQVEDELEDAPIVIAQHLCKSDAELIVLLRNHLNTFIQALRVVKEASNAEVMMDTMSILGIGDWLNGQYRKDYAHIHTELIAALRAFHESEKD